MIGEPFETIQPPELTWTNSKRAIMTRSNDNLLFATTPEANHRTPITIEDQTTSCTPPPPTMPLSPPTPSTPTPHPSAGPINFLEPDQVIIHWKPCWSQLEHRHPGYRTDPRPGPCRRRSPRNFKTPFATFSTRQKIPHRGHWDTHVGIGKTHIVQTQSIIINTAISSKGRV